MYNLIKHYRFIILCLLTVLTPSVAAASSGRKYAGMEAGYLSGDFGTTSESELYYVKPEMGYISSRYNFSVEVPYFHSSFDSNNESNSETGIGDIVIYGGKVLVPANASGFSVNGALSLKLPTADETKGLGSGKTDVGAYLALNKQLSSFKLSLLGGFVKIGDPDFADYNDVYQYGAGLSKVFHRTAVYTLLEGRRAMVNSFDNPLELSFGFFHKLSDSYSLKGSILAGLSDGSPDFGTSIGFARWF